MGKNEKAKSSPGLKAGVIIFTVLDVILLVLLIVFLVLPESGGSSLKADLSKDFSPNADTYYDMDYETDYSSDASVNYSGGNLSVQTPSDAASENEADGKYSGFVFPDSDIIILSDARIKATVTDAETCRRAINEIYARHGYQFTLQENIDFFNQYDWYREMDKESDMAKVSAQFSSTEKANADKLQLYEQDNGWN